MACSRPARDIARALRSGAPAPGDTSPAPRPTSAGDFDYALSTAGPAADASQAFRQAQAVSYVFDRDRVPEAD